MNPAPRIYFGTAGWSYNDWKETVYRLPPAPPRLNLFGEAEPSPSKYAADQLEYISRYMDMVEINSSFYKIPSPKAVADWAKRVAHHPSFFFTAKLHLDFTHNFLRDEKQAAIFLNAFEPLFRAGRLHSLLAQFKYDMQDSPEHREMLLWLKKRFSPLIVEVRHISWQSVDAIKFFQDNNIPVASLDYPLAANSFNLYDQSCADTGYLRLHGRNRKAWFSKEATVEEVYNYNYSDQEIEDIFKRCRKLLKKNGEVIVVGNNHFLGQALSASLRLKSAMLQQKVKCPPALLETYPELFKYCIPE